jgi:O-antigen/teichoic acid export membrane protein
MLPELTLAPTWQLRCHGFAGRAWFWLTRGILASADQGLNSGANFVVSILLARWLSAEHYGAYVLAFSVFVFTTAVHQALVLEPMSIFGASLDGPQRSDYLWALFRIQVIAGTVIGALMAISAVIVSTLAVSTQLGFALGGLALTSPCMLMFSFVRSASYLGLAPGPASACSFVYSSLVIGGVSLFHLYGWVSVFLVFAWTGASAAVAAVLLWLQLKPAQPLQDRSVSMRAVCRDHWNYGRWPLLVVPLTLIRENLFLTFTGVYLGLRYAGVLQGMLNFVLPLTQLGTCLCRLFQPYLARIAAEKGSAAIRAGVLKVGILFTVVGAGYATCLYVFHGPLLHFLYADKFDKFSGLVSWMGLSGMFYIAGYVPSLGLRSIQSPSSIVIAYAGSALASFVIGIPLMWRFHMGGAVVGLCISNLVAFILAAEIFRRKTQPFER